MKLCLKCGKENENYLCENCKNKVNIAELCEQIISYNNEEENLIFETVAGELGGLFAFRNIVIELTEDFETPKKELLRLRALTCNWKYLSIAKERREILKECIDICLKSDIKESERNYILSLLFCQAKKDFDFENAEKYSIQILDIKDLDKRIYYELSDFYNKTRRYDLAKVYIEKRKEKIDENDDDQSKEKIEKLSDEINKRKNGNIKEYVPMHSENKEKYKKFMMSLGINIDNRTNSNSAEQKFRENKIPDNEYPSLLENEIIENTFNTFVAFDLESTGFTNIDEITEIGAIRVVNGKIVETKEFVFESLVKPDKKKVSKEIEEKTGITNEMLKNEKKIWDVFPLFMDFVKDDILVGFNCMGLDRRLLRRAGRYSHIIIENQIYDILKNIKKYDIKIAKLENIAKKLEIEVPTAHRALADAITTAKVFMKLKGLKEPIKETKKKNFSLIKIKGGRNQQNDTIKEIWENLILDCNEVEKDIIEKIIKMNKNNIEKPIYNANVVIEQTKDIILVNEIWEKPKIMLFLSDNEKSYQKALKTGWKCFKVDKNLNIEELINELEMVVS